MLPCLLRPPLPHPPSPSCSSTRVERYFGFCRPRAGSLPQACLLWLRIFPLILWDSEMSARRARCSAVAAAIAMQRRGRPGSGTATSLAPLFIHALKRRLAAGAAASATQSATTTTTATICCIGSAIGCDAATRKLQAGLRLRAKESLAEESVSQAGRESAESALLHQEDCLSSWTVLREEREGGPF